MSIRVEALTGPSLRDALPALARLRITVFRDWPYLYDGTLDYEESYIRKFSAAQDAIIVAAWDGGEIVGVSTGSPLEGHADEFADPLRARRYDTARMFYFGESVLLARYRGHGIGNTFFDQREAHARQLGRFTDTTFCAVARPNDHPMRPADYRPLDGFWTKRGYCKVEGLVAHFSWKDIDKPAESEKVMQFWTRSL